MIPAAAPPRVRDRLRAAPDGQVAIVHRGDRAVYVDVDGWCVGVVVALAAHVPCAVRLVHWPDGGIPDRAHLADGTLHLDDHPLTIARIEQTSVPHLDPRRRASVDPNASVSAFVDSVLPAWRIDAAAAVRLLGRGEGLTPLGDDVLAGWLALHRAVGVATPEVDAAVAGAAARTTLLSATLLDCADHGEVLPEYAGWIRSIGTPDESARVRALHRVGATSGAGLHLGGRIALDQIREAA